MQITRGQINQVPVTVTEQTTLTAGVHYLFEFQRKASNVKIYCIAVTTYNGRIDYFNIEETDSPNPLTAKVKLHAGDYAYRIYQQTSSTNLDPSLTTISASGLVWVEQGICSVFKSIAPVPEYVAAPLTNPVYESQS